MQTLECFEEAVQVANQLGYQIRHEWLGGTGGGVCEFGGKKWIFIDLALNTAEQLEQICDSLKQCPEIHSAELSSGMLKLLQLDSVPYVSAAGTSEYRRAA